LGQGQWQTTELEGKREGYLFAQSSPVTSTANWKSEPEMKMTSIVGILVLIGMIYGSLYLIPPTRSGTSEIMIKASPDQIIATLKDVERQPAWRANVSKIIVTPSGWQEVTQRGETIDFRWVVLSDAQVELVFKSSAGYEGTWSARLTQAGEETKVSATEIVNIKQPIGRLLSRLFFNPEEFAMTYLKELKVAVET
jgi:hypothetical protein